jgi:hypothetical protein
MDGPRRWSNLREPLKGAGYVIALAVLVTLAGAVLAGSLVWLMT